MVSSPDRGLLLLRIEQNIEQLIERRIRSFVHLFDFNRTDWMLNHEQRMIRRAKSFAFGFGQWVERVRDHCDCESPPFLQLD